MNWPNYDSEEAQNEVNQHQMMSKKKPRFKSGTNGESRQFHVDQDTYTSGQAAKLLGIPPRTLRRYLSIGKIEGEQNPITQTWQITSESLIRFIEKQGGKAIITPTELTVLVIDGKPIVADILRRIAEQTRPGLIVQEFQEVGDALIESGVQRPALIVIDTATPFYDGIGLLRLLRSNPHTQSSKILCITDSEAKIHSLKQSGATLTLVKPFGYNDLASQLDIVFPIQDDLPS